MNDTFESDAHFSMSALVWNEVFSSLHNIYILLFWKHNQSNGIITNQVIYASAEKVRIFVIIWQTAALHPYLEMRKG